MDRILVRSDDIKIPLDIHDNSPQRDPVFGVQTQSTIMKKYFILQKWEKGLFFANRSTSQWKEAWVLIS